MCSIYISSLYLLIILYTFVVIFFFFNDTATTEIYTLSLHDALPIYMPCIGPDCWKPRAGGTGLLSACPPADRKSTRLNSSHQIISYAVFCLKKKKTNTPSVWLPTTPRTALIGLLCPTQTRGSFIFRI